MTYQHAQTSSLLKNHNRNYDNWSCNIPRALQVLVLDFGTSNLLLLLQLCEVYITLGSLVVLEAGNLVFFFFFWLCGHKIAHYGRVDIMYRILQVETFNYQCVEVANDAASIYN